MCGYVNGELGGPAGGSRGGGGRGQVFWAGVEVWGTWELCKVVEGGLWSGIGRDLKQGCVKECLCGGSEGWEEVVEVCGRGGKGWGERDALPLCMECGKGGRGWTVGCDPDARRRQAM